MKTGRKRQFIGIASMREELEALHELRLRADDLIEDLPTEATLSEVSGHTIAQLFDHMVATELKWLAVAADVDRYDSSDIQALDSLAKAVLGAWGLQHPVPGSRFTTVGQLLRHLQWHWSYHSAQIGLIRRELGFKYGWQ